MTMRDSPSPFRSWWMAGLVLAGALGVAPAEDPAPAPTPAPTPAPADAAPPSADAVRLRTLVDDALTGSENALSSLRVAAPVFPDEQAMAALERVRASGASRHSAIAACFLRHREAWIQRTAITTIARLGVDGPETVAALVKAMQDPAPLVAQAAAAALADLRDARSWAPLIELLTAADGNLVRIAHDSLQRQTMQTLPPERKAWDDWLEARRTDEEAQFARFQVILADGSGDPVAAVDGLASLALLRDQATAVLVTLVEHPDATVRAHVERHLRQWTGTLGNEALTVAVDRAQAHAVAPPAPPPTATATAVSTTPTAAAPTGPGFFESTYGLVAIVTAVCGVLAVLLWFLRTPAGRVVQGATASVTKRIARSRVVVMISNGTKRIARSMPKPIREVTKRFASPARQVAGKLANETQRMLNPHKPK